MPHPAISAGRVAVITGGASGIGLAAARKFAGLGLKIVLADLKGEALDKAGAAVAALAKTANPTCARSRPMSASWRTCSA